MWILQVMMALVLFCPFIALFVLFFIGRKLKLTTARSFGYAADTTTIILFFSVGLAIQSVWHVKAFVWLAISAVVMAIIFTYIDWRTKKEIIVAPLLRRIWRFYFIALVILYGVILLAGLTFWVMDYMTVV